MNRINRKNNAVLGLVIGSLATLIPGACTIFGGFSIESIGVTIFLAVIGGILGLITGVIPVIDYEKNPATGGLKFGVILGLLWFVVMFFREGTANFFGAILFFITSTISGIIINSNTSE